MYQAGASLGSVLVATTSNGALQPEYWAQRLADKVIFIGDNVDPVIREQAIAFKEQIRQAALNMFQEARKSDRAYVATKLSQQGLGSNLNLSALIQGL